MAALLELIMDTKKGMTQRKSTVGFWRVNHSWMQTEHMKSRKEG
jgi:hypothetical protein